MTNLHNPTGRFADRSSIEALAALCRDYECHLIVDEAYLDLRHVLFDEPRWTAASLGDHVAATNSLTKVYGLGPLRVGWLIASGNVMNTARRLTDHMHVVNSAPSTGLGIVAWENIDRLTARTKSVYEQSWPVMSAWLEANPDVKTFGNDGALFQYLRLPEIDDTSVFAQLLFEDYGILVTPGRFFAQKDWLRIGFGIPPDDLAEALSHIDTARSSMTQPLG
jgi:aspartate/methionine/tyrosine aminotransferase